MSRIDHSSIPSESFIKQSSSTKAAAAAPRVAAAVATQLRRTRERGPVAASDGARRTSALAAAKTIEAGDLDGFAGRSSEEMLSDLSRLLVRFEEHDSQSGEDDISVLCRTMLEENIRRLETFVLAREADGAGDYHGV